MPKPSRKGGFSSARAPFEINGSSVAPGSQKTIELRVARLASGSWAHMPVVVIHGKKEGPTVWLSGAVHGDELNGVEIIRRIILQVAPKELAGTILAVPVVNVFGLANGDRYLPDRRDLNRSFPGSTKGSLAARLARLFFDEIVRRFYIFVLFAFYFINLSFLQIIFIYNLNLIYTQIYLQK